jgi:hypothetical protein
MTSQIRSNSSEICRLRIIELDGQVRELSRCRGFNISNMCDSIAEPRVRADGRKSCRTRVYYSETLAEARDPGLKVQSCRRHDEALRRKLEVRAGMVEG